MENKLKVLVTDSQGNVLVKLDDLYDVHLIGDGDKGISITHSVSGNDYIEKTKQMLKYIQVSNAHIKDLLKRHKILRQACRHFKSEERKIYKLFQQENPTKAEPYKPPFREYEET